MGKRRSLVFLGLLLAGLPLAFLIRGLTDEGWRQIASVRALEARDVIYLPDVRIFVVHEDPAVALSAISTHLEEPVAYCPSGDTFHELAHGSTWNRLGFYVDGPAPTGLERLATRVRDGIVEVNFTITHPGAPRGAGPQLGPNGRFCSYEEPGDATNGFLPSPPAPSSREPLSRRAGP
jgi:hypothetical protein